MSEPLTTYWVEVDDLLYTQGNMMKNAFEHCDYVPVFKAADVQARQAEFAEMLKQTYLDLRTTPMSAGVEQAKVRIDLWLKKIKGQP